jgi:chloramphenicol-sensitive protein RarD
LVTNKNIVGLSAALSSYIFWGLSPVYWKLLGEIPGVEILAHRIVWSLVLLAGAIIVLRQGGEVIQAFKNKKVFLLLLVSSSLISLNWGIYIISVNSGHMLQASIGYYINPFVSMLAGIIIFKERLNLLQSLAIVFAALGVIVYASGLNTFPWAALGLAFSFAAYGAIRKYVPVKALTGLFAETIIIFPIASSYIAYLSWKGTGSISDISFSTGLLLIGSGVVTSLPLLSFSAAVKRLKLVTIGLIQFIAPSITLVLGVFVYGEEFTKIHAITFTLIWICVAFFTLDALIHLRKDPTRNS